MIQSKDKWIRNLNRWKKKLKQIRISWITD